MIVFSEQTHRNQLDTLYGFQYEMYQQIQTLDAAVMTAIRHRNQNFIIKIIKKMCPRVRLAHIFALLTQISEAYLSPETGVLPPEIIFTNDVGN